MTHSHRMCSSMRGGERSHGRFPIDVGGYNAACGTHLIRGTSNRARLRSVVWAGRMSCTYSELLMNCEILRRVDVDSDAGIINFDVDNLLLMTLKERTHAFLRLALKQIVEKLG